jgi:hypothetical protein
MLCRASCGHLMTLCDVACDDRVTCLEGLSNTLQEVQRGVQRSLDMYTRTPTLYAHFARAMSDAFALDYTTTAAYAAADAATRQALMSQQVGHILGSACACDDVRVMMCV